jgi:hypothetical protein
MISHTIMIFARMLVVISFVVRLLTLDAYSNFVLRLALQPVVVGKNADRPGAL